MRKLVFFLVGVCLAVGLAFLLVVPSPTEACGFREPVTLLELYKGSDAIYIGRYSGTETGELLSENDDHRIIGSNKYFDVSYTLKGDPVKTFTHSQSEYTSKDQHKGYETLEQVEAASIVPDIHLEDEEEGHELKPGDVVLLFARKNDEGESLELTEYSDGLKKLPAEELTVYEARIKELNTIFAAEKPDPQAITDWLVRCAEERATRWEGAYQLRTSFAALDAMHRREAKRKAKELSFTPENAEDDDAGDDDDEDESEDEDTSLADHKYASLLTDYHKQTLSSVLLNSEFQTVPQPTDRAILVHGDRELISLISRWADVRLTELFMSRLRSGAYTSPENTELMVTISSILDDQMLADIAEKHSDIDHNDDDEAVDESDLEPEENTDDEAKSGDQAADDPDTGAGIPEDDAANGDEIEDADEDSADEAETAEQETKPVFTYKRLRKEIIEKFLARAETLITDPTKRVGKHDE